MADNSPTDSQDTVPPWWVPIWEFFIHAVVGTALFLLIAMPAVALDQLVETLRENLNIRPLLVWSFMAVEYLILFSDLVLFIVFIIRSITRTIPRL